MLFGSIFSELLAAKIKQAGATLEAQKEQSSEHAEG